MENIFSHTSFKLIPRKKKKLFVTEREKGYLKMIFGLNCREKKK